MFDLIFLSFFSTLNTRRISIIDAQGFTYINSWAGDIESKCL